MIIKVIIIVGLVVFCLVMALIVRGEDTRSVGD